MNRLAYLLVASVLLGAHFLAIPLGIAQLSAYRFIIILSLLALAHRVFIKDPNLKSYYSGGKIFSAYQLFYLFWLIYGGLSLIWAENVSRWIIGIFFLGTGIFSILFITTFIKKEFEVKKLFKVFFVMTVVHHISAWIESFSVVYPKTTFANQNDFATLILAGLFVGFIIFLNTRNNWFKLVLILYFISGFFLIEISGSRANSLALLVGIVAIITMKVMNYKISKSTFYLILGGVFVFLLLVILIAPLRELILEYTSELLMGPIRPRTSNRNRINMILNGFYFLLITLGFGVGAGNVEHYLVNHSILYVDAPNIHNWFMDILTGYGVIVFTLYIVMYVYILRKLFMNYFYSKDTFIRNASLALFAYLIAFIISSASSASNMIIEWQWVFWGIIIAFIQYTESSELTTAQASKSSKKFIKKS